MKQTNRKGNKGFTLIELLVVLVIIGILAAIAIPRFTEVRERAYFAAMRADVRNLVAQQELHFASNYTYSGTLTDLDFVTSEGVTVSAEGDATGWSATATHEALSDDRGCAVFMGDATAPSVGSATPATEGEIACTE